ncbi:MAG: helix-turn-helix domain-containing protein [Phycisphaerae bacterium]|nr:helix-turn-helix domain-containing protein [Phycisphaerae bacterium]
MDETHLPEKAGETRPTKTDSGYTNGQIAAMLKAPRSRVSEWLRNYEQFGYDGLLEGYRPGRPLALTPANKQTLEDVIDPFQVGSTGPSRSPVAGA